MKNFQKILQLDHLQKIKEMIRMKKQYDGVKEDLILLS